jgi:hypothetical protein
MPKPGMTGLCLKNRSSQPATRQSTKRQHGLKRLSHKPHT